MEWSPPYDWQNPVRPKERQIQEAVRAVRELFADKVAGAVPVCAAPGKVYGVEEWLLPALAELLEEGRAVGLLRCLRAEANQEKVRRVVRQVMNAGRQLLWAVLQPRPEGAPAGREPPPRT
jgi:hypothetical protein